MRTIRGEAPGGAGRDRLADAAVLGAGVALTLVFTYGLARRPVPATAALALLALLAGIILFRREIAAVRLGPLVSGMVLVVPLAALVGTAAAIPAFPQLFAFRLLLVAIALLGLPLLLVRHGSVSLARWRPALPLALWFAWLSVAIMWAPDKAAGLRYLIVLATMLAVVVAAAAAGLSRRRLQAFGVTMIVGYAFIAGVTVLEYTTGFHMPESRLLTVVTSQTYAVTSVFHNQNDLATYLAICWPFLLATAFFTRSVRWLGLALVFAAFGAAAFVRTGSRSSLIAVGIATVVILLLHARPRARLQTRRARALGVLLAVVLIAGTAYLLFNNSQSSMLRQFRLADLTKNLSAKKGSGEVRTDLVSRGLDVAGGSWLLGAGPGQIEGIVTSGTDALTVGNMHNWWLENYADGGLPGLTLQLVFFVGLAWGLLRRARTHGDPFVRYLAGGAFAALVGFTIGALGPSSSLSFAPMWTLFGLGLAVLALPAGGTATDSALPATGAAPATDAATGPRAGS
jgi:teichuronic acid biosynthesis protein TuaE